MGRLIITPLPQLSEGESSRDDVYLGPWCFVSSTGHTVADIQKHNLIPPPEKDAQESIALNDYLNDLIDRFMPPLTDFANQIHGTNHGISFWRPIYLPWLHEWLFFCHSIFKRVLETKRFGQLQTTIAKEFQFHVEGAKEFSMLRSSPEFALLLMSDVIRHMQDIDWLAVTEIDFFSETLAKEKMVVEDLFPRSNNPRHNSLPDRINKRFRRRSKLFLKGITGLMPKQELILNLLADPLGLLRQRSFTETIRPIDWARFENNDIAFEPGNPFEQVVHQIVKNHIPLKILRYEEITFHKQILHVGYKHHRLGNEYFTSHLREQGSLWYGDQHGGGYGMFSVPDLRHEFDPVDRYITWGWSDGGNDRDIFDPLPSPYLAYKLKSEPEDRSDLVFIPEPVTSVHPYRQHAFGMTFSNLACLQMRIDFLNGLSSQAAAHCVYRHKHFQLEHILDDSHEIRTLFPNIPVCSTRDKGFLDVMENTRLFVTESLNSSTLIQATAMDVPTVAYYDPEQCTFNTPFAKAAKKLEAAGVLHKSPQEAAEHVNAIWDDVQAWWEGDECKKAIDYYRRHWVWQKGKWYRDWIQYLRKELKRLARRSP